MRVNFVFISLLQQGRRIYNLFARSFDEIYSAEVSMLKPQGVSCFANVMTESNTEANV